MTTKTTKMMIASAFLALVVGMPSFAGADHGGWDYQDNHAATAPGSATIEDVIGGGIAICSALAPPPADCATGGVGGAFFDLTHLNTAAATVSQGAGTHALNPDTATGTCTVEKISPVLIFSGFLEFLCGVDADDDGFVTDTDASGSGVSGCTNDNDNAGAASCGDGEVNPVTPCSNDVADHKMSSADTCFYDDMAWTGQIDTLETSATIYDMCLRRDTNENTSVSAAGDNWDDVVVFLGANVNPVGNFQPLSYYVGVVNITLSLNVDAAGHNCADDTPGLAD